MPRMHDKRIRCELPEGRSLIDCTLEKFPNFESLRGCGQVGACLSDQSELSRPRLMNLPQ